MANRYWVGTSGGTWDTTTTTNWSATSGGTGGASVPTAADSVFFDQSATYAVTMTGALNCFDITVSAGTVTFQNGTTPTLSVAGNWSTIAGTVWNTTGAVTFTATTAKTINTGGITISSPITFNGAAGSWTLQSNLTQPTTATTTLTQGTLALSTFTLSTGLFASNNSNTRTINFGTGQITLTNAATNTIWNTSTITGLTISGTPLVACQGGGTSVTKTINTGALSAANAISFSLLETTGTVTYAFTAGNVVQNLTINGLQTLSNIAITIYGSFTHSTSNGTTTFTAGTNAWTFGATTGSYTITPVAGTTYDFPWTFGSASSTATWQLAANLTLGATRQLTLVTGTFDFNSKTFSGAGITISNSAGTFTLANTGTSSFTTTVPITLATGTFTLPFNVTTSSTSGFTFFTGTNTGTLNLNSFILTTPIFTTTATTGAKTLAFGTGKIVLNGSATATIFNISTAVANVTITGTPLVECSGGGSAVTKTINTGAPTAANAISFSLLETTGTVTYAFTASNAINNLVINGSQTLSNIAITIYGAFTHSTANGTTTFTAGANAWTFGATSGSYTITNLAGTTYDFPWTFGSASSTATWQLAANLTLGATRQLTLVNGTTDFNSKTISAAGITILTGTPTIANTGTVGFTTTLPITHTSGTLTLGLNLTTSAATGYTFTAGTLALSTYTLTTPVFLSNNANARTLNFGTGQIAVTGNNATILDFTTATNLTTSGTVYINCTYAGSTGTRTISLGFSLTQAASYPLAFSGTTGIVLSPSATDTLALNGSFGSLDFTSFSGTLSNTVKTIYGNLTIPSSGGTYTAGTNAWTFAATSSATINTNSVLLDWPITFNGTGGVWQLSSNLTMGSTRTVTLTAGTVNLNNFVLTAFALSSNNTNTRALQFGTTGYITLAGSATTVVDFTSMTSFTYTGTPRIYSTYSGATGTRTFNIGGTAGATTTNVFDVSIGSTGTGIVITAGTDTVDLIGNFNNIDLTNFTMTLPNSTRTIYGNITIPATGGTFTAGTNVTTLTTNGNSNIFANSRLLDFPVTIGNGTSTGNVFLQTGNLVLGSTRTLSFNSGNFQIQSNTVVISNSFSSSVTVARQLIFGSGTPSAAIYLTGSATTVINMTNAQNFSYSGTPIIYANYTGGTGTRIFAMGNTTAFSNGNEFPFNINGSSGVILSTSTDTITITGQIGTLDLRNFTGTLTNDAKNVRGSFYTSATGGTLTAGANIITLSGTNGSFIIDSANRAIDFPISVDSVNGNYTFNNSYICGTSTTASTRNFNFNTGNLIIGNNIVLYTGNFTTSTANLRNLNFSGTTGQINLTSNNTTLWNSNNGTNLSYSGNVIVNSIYTGNTGTRVFDFGNVSGTYAQNVQITTGSIGFNINTANDSVTLTGSIGTANLTGLLATITNTARTIYGNLYIPASGGAFTAGTSVTTFGNTTGTATVDTSARTLQFPLTFNGVGGNWTLANNLVANATTALTLANGQVDFQQKTLTFANITIAGGNAGLTNLSTSLNFVHSTGNLTVLSGAINSSTSGTYTIAAGLLSANSTFTTGAFTLTAGNVNAYAALNTGTFTHTAGNLSVLTGGTANTGAYTHNGGVILLNGGDLIAPTFTSNSGTARTITFTNGNINATSTGTVINMANATALTSTTTTGNINITNTGSTAITITPGALAQANTMNYNILGGTYALTINAANSVNSLNFTGFSGSLVDTAINIYGNLTLGTALTITGSNALTFTGTLNQSLTSNASTLDRPIIVNKTGGVLTVADQANIGSTRLVTLTAGNVLVNASTNALGGITFTAGLLTTNATLFTSAFTHNGGNINVYSDLTCTTLTSNSGTTRGINFPNDNGNINVTSTGTVVNMANTTALTSIGNGNIQLTNTGSTAITVTPGALAEANAINYVINGNGTYPLTITAGNVFDLNFANYSGSLTDTAITVFGNLSLSSTMTISGSNAVTLAAANGNQLITTNTLTLDRPLTVNKAGNTAYFTNVANLGTTRTLTLTAGTLTANNTLNTGIVTHTSGNFVFNGVATTLAYTMAGGNANINNSVSATAFTHNGGTINLVSDLTVLTFTSNSGTARAINFTSGNINVTSAGTVFNSANTTAMTVTGTGSVNVLNSGSTAITITPGAAAEANSINFNFTAGTYNLTISAANVVKSLNFSGYSGALQDTAATIYGNVLISNTMTITGANALTFGSGLVSQYVTSNTITIDRPVTVNKATGSLVFVDTANLGTSRTFTLTTGSVTSNAALNIGAVTHTAGNFNANNTTTTQAYTMAGGNLNVNAAVSTQAFTQNGGNINLLTDLTVPTFTSNSGTTRAINFNSSNINVTSTGTVVNMANTTALTTTGNQVINITNNGSTAITVTPGSPSSANAIAYNFVAGTYPLTITAGSVGTLNFTGYAGTVTNTILSLYGNIIISTGLTLSSGTNSWTFATTSNQYITSNGKTFDFPINMNSTGNVIINDNLNIGTTRTFTLGNGNLNLNSLTLNTGFFSTVTGTKSIVFNGGTLLITGSSGTAFNNASPTGFTTSKGTANGIISMNAATAKTFVGGGGTYFCSLDQGGAGDLIITGNNIFDKLTASYANTANANIQIPASGTTTVNNGIGNGNSTSKLFGIKSSTSGTRAILNYPTTANVVANYISTQDTNFVNANNLYTDGTKPWYWYLGSGSINNGQVAGALFIDNNGINSPIMYVLLSGTSWTVPDTFNSANNTVHIYGAGGGSSGSYNSGSIGKIPGSGGGGGGYTKVTNLNLTPNTTVTYSIGTGGTAGGAGTSNGGNGGNTTFSTYTANGGKGGTIQGSPSNISTGGAGGTGSTFNGGAGGNGGPAAGSSAGVSAGGGGGGAGGFFGNGGNGGAGSSSAGGGGGGSGGGSNGAAGTTSGGSGGNNYYGKGGGAASTQGVLGGGGGGGGGVGAISTLGAADILSNSFGGAGGGGGSSGNTGPHSAFVNLTIGAGAGGAGVGGINPASFAGQAGANGGIVIVYSAGSVFNSSMLLVF